MAVEAATVEVAAAVEEAAEVTIVVAPAVAVVAQH